MGFFDLFRRKKEVTPAMLREMMKELREGIELAVAIENADEKKLAIEEMISRVANTMGIVDETLLKVEKEMASLTKRDFWLASELIDGDLSRLQKGKNFLMRTKEELKKMNIDLSALVGIKVEEKPEDALDEEVRFEK